MAVYEVDIAKFKVNKQEGHALCWAASAIGIAAYYGYQTPDQKGLASAYPNKSLGNDPSKVLKDHFGLTATTLLDWKDVTATANRNDRLSDLKENLKAYLAPPAGGPMIGAITEKDNLAWQITKNNSTVDYTYRHAVVVFRYDSSGDTVSFMDPARDDIRGREVTVTVAQLVDGFRYIEAADFGTETRAALPASVLSAGVSARLYKLIGFMKPKSTP